MTKATTLPFTNVKVKKKMKVVWVARVEKIEYKIRILSGITTCPL